MQIRPLLLSALALSVLGACRRGSTDASKVLANVAGQKITQADFETMVAGSIPDPAKVQTVLSSPQFQAQKPDLVHQLAFQKAIIAFAKQQGLDKDPAVGAQVEGAVAQAYYQAMMLRRAGTGKVPPSDEQLKAMYEEIKGRTKDLPPFEQVKLQLAQGYGQWLLQKDLRAAIPITFSAEIGEPGGGS